MNTIIRLNSGMAISPQRELKRFARMAARGYQLSGLSLAGHGWQFTEAEPENAIFDMSYEPTPPADYFEVFHAAGWKHVLSFGSTHIFKATPGTPAVHSSTDSYEDELRRQCKQYLLYSTVAILIFILAHRWITAGAVPSWAQWTLRFLVCVPVIYTIVPLLGFFSRLRRSTHPMG